MEPLPKIPSPLSLRWREFRYSFMPTAVFVVASVTSVVIWKDRVAMPQMVGEVETLASSVVSGEDGLVVEIKVERFTTVKKGQAIAEIRTSDPESVRVALATITTDLQVLQTRLTQDQQRILQDFEQLRLNSFGERVALATANVELEFAKSELKRISKLYAEKLVSDGEFEHAQAIATSRQAEVDERTRLLNEIEKGLKDLSPVAADKFTATISGSIDNAIAAQEEKLKLSRQSVTLRAPIDGVVTEVFHMEGERILAGEAIVTITSTDPKHIIGYLSQPIVVNPQIGDTVEVRSRSDRNKVGVAKVLKVGQIIEPISKRLVIQESTGSRAGLPVLISMPDDIAFLPGEVVDLAFRSE
jgi:multidrug resistance efflux pump